MAGLAVQNFVSAARRDGRARRGRSAASRAARRATLGNFWVDLYRSLVYILLPLVAGPRGDPRLAGRRRRRSTAHATATTLEGATADDRARPGRVADRDQAARHERRRLLQLELGRPVREPERLHELPRDALDPADPGRAGVHVRPDGRRAPAGAGRSSPRCSRCSSIGVAVALPARAARLAGAARLGREHHRRATARAAATWPTRRSASASPTPRSGRPRRRTPRTARSTAATTRSPRTAAPCPLVNMFTGEVIFGGVGSGLYGMFFYVVIAVFVAGLMVGPHARVPRQEDRGARDQARGGRGAVRADDGARDDGRSRSSTDRGLASIFNPGAHGFTEALYAYDSQSNNNGSAFAGYGATDFSADSRHGRALARPLRAADRRARARRLAGGEEDGARPRPARSAPTARRSSCCSSA